MRIGITSDIVLNMDWSRPPKAYATLLEAQHTTSRGGEETMFCRVGIVCVVAAFSLLTQGAWALEGIEGASFRAICKDLEIHAYRNDNHDATTDGWATDEKYFTPMEIIYLGGDEALVDKMTVKVFWLSSTLMIGLRPYVAPFPTCGGVWSYVINLKLRSVLAAEVHGCSPDMLDIDSTKVRSIEYGCSFD